MTSKNLFFNLMKEELKQKIWLIASSILMLFFTFPIITLLKLEQDYHIPGEMSSRSGAIPWELFAQSVTLENYMVMAATVTIAFFSAMQGFSYLHSKKQIDLYHATPVKREMLFAVKYVSGALLYLVPFVILACVSLGICAVQGVQIWEKPFLTSFLLMLLVTTVFYLLVYTVMIIALLLTGNKVISVFSILAFMLYGPVIYMISDFMKNTFWFTKCGWSAYDHGWKLVKWTSAVANYGFTASDIINAGGTGGAGNVGAIAGVVLETVLLLLLAVFLHKKRSSESAGRAIAFPLIEPFLKVMLVVPFALLGGIFFYMLSDDSGIIWYVFGVILTFLIGNALIESIFVFDVRKAFSHKKIWVINGIILIAVSLFFIMDIGGYDTYLPQAEKVESMAVNLDFGTYNDNFFRQDKDGNYINAAEEQLEVMKVEEFMGLYEFTAAKVADIKNSSRLDLIHSGGVIEVVEDGIGQMPDVIYASDMSVRYNLKNGKQVSRFYRLNLEKDIDAIRQIYETPEYLSAVNSISEKESYDKVYYNSGYNEMQVQIQLNTEEIIELGRLYQEDIVNLKLSLDRKMQPIGSIQLGNTRTGAQRYFYVYPFCDKTIAYMKQAGGENIVIEEKLKIDDAIKMKAVFDPDHEINYYSDYSDSYMNTEYQFNPEVSTWNIEDEALIQEILEEGIIWEYGADNPLVSMNMEPEIMVMLDYYSESSENRESVVLGFLKGELTEKIKNSMKE